MTPLPATCYIGAWPPERPLGRNGPGTLRRERRELSPGALYGEGLGPYRKRAEELAFETAGGRLIYAGLLRIGAGGAGDLEER